MSEFEKVQCTCAHGYTCRAMTDPSCCAHSCDYNDAVDALNKVTAERDSVLAQNAELAAAVVVLSSKLKEVAALVDGDGFSAVQWILDNHADIGQLAIAPPQQHLRDVRAEAGRAGYLIGIQDWRYAELKHQNFNIERSADNYAERVKAGE